MFLVFQSVAYPVVARVASVAVNAYLYAHLGRDAYKAGSFIGRKYDQWKLNRLLKNSPAKDIGPDVGGVQPC